jgi:hypothetical protein
MLDNEIVRHLASYLKYYAQPGPRLPASVLWYISAEQTVLEIIFFTLFFTIWFLVTLRQRTSDSLNTVSNGKMELNTLPTALKIMRIILLLCLVVTIGHKFYGEKMALMFMPCHVVTAFYLYSLFHPDKAYAQAAFNISVHYQFFTWLALALPDHNGLNQTGEILNFWIHHWLLVIIPFYIIFTRHFEMDKRSHYYFKLAICIAGIIHYDVMLLSGLFTGQNVGYMIFPPSKSPAKGPFFRVTHMIFLVFMGYFGGYVIPQILISLSKRLGFPYYKTKPADNLKGE